MGFGASNCAFGGPDFDILYITAGSGLYKLQLKVKGRKTTGELPVGIRQKRPGMTTGRAAMPDFAAPRLSWRFLPNSAAAFTATGAVIDCSAGLKKAGSLCIVRP